MSLAKTASLEIRTPEGVSFHLPLASPVLRALALGIDLMVITAMVMLFSRVADAFSLLFQDSAQAGQILLGFVVGILYGIAMEWICHGQTIGKAILRLQVVDERGLSLAPSQVILRNLFRFVDGLPQLYLVGGISCLLSKRCQRLGDIAAGTVVIRRVKVERPSFEQIQTDGVNSFREYPHLEARLRQNVTPDAARIGLDAMIRREQLDSNHRLKVFRELADYYRTLVEFPEECVQGISDEQYVRNVVETLYRKASV